MNKDNQAPKIEVNPTQTDGPKPQSDRLKNTVADNTKEKQMGGDSGGEQKRIPSSED